MKPYARLSLTSLVFFLISLCVSAVSVLAEYPASFASTFSLAEHSACKEVVLQLKDGATVSALESRLHALTQDIFPYQMEVTNGYQHGFFLEALRGYAAMQNDNPPVAFRHFNNALLYYDEDAVFGHTEPLAEIYSAIGETCVAVGRYMDAKDWLDTAFLEAGDNTRIQANVLRASIRLGHAIGDFPDILLSYQYLQSIDTLNREDIADYAQVLFWSRKDREGFGHLLRGIATHGIDNDLGVRDPLVNSFLNNIMRADDSEVRWFYDLLGWSITDARAKEGDEEYIAFLVNARMLFCKVYAFLDPEDDLERVSQRIDAVKEQLAAGYDVFGESQPLPPRTERERIKRLTPNRAETMKDDGSITVTPYIAIEDALMMADWHLKNKREAQAVEIYDNLLQLATGVYAHVGYDHTHTRNAIYIGLMNASIGAHLPYHGNYFGTGIITIKSEIVYTKWLRDYTNHLNDIVFDNSLRSQLLNLELKARALITNDIHYSYIDVVLDDLPFAHNSVKRYLANKAAVCIEAGDITKAIDVLGTYERRMGVLPAHMAVILSQLHIIKGDGTEAFNVLVRSLRNTLQMRAWKVIYLNDQCANLWGFADSESLYIYADALPKVSFYAYVREKNAIQNIGRATFNARIRWKDDVAPYAVLFKELYNTDRHEDAYRLFHEKEALQNQPGHYVKYGVILSHMGKADEAYEYFEKSYMFRKRYVEDISNILYPEPEFSHIKALLDSLCTEMKTRADTLLSGSVDSE